MFTFDPTRPVQTRDGRPARIISTDCKSSIGKHIVALIANSSSTEETSENFYPNGRLFPDQEFCRDLVNIPETITVWVNLWQISGGCCFCNFSYSEEDARRDSNEPGSRLTLLAGPIPLTITHGDIR